MIINVYCVKDTLVNNCMPPVLGKTDAAMVRSFGDAVTKGDTPISQHPEDYVLLRVGTFDDETGMIARLDCPEVICHASDFMKGEQK